MTAVAARRLEVDDRRMQRIRMLSLLLLLLWTLLVRPVPPLGSHSDLSVLTTDSLFYLLDRKVHFLFAVVVHVDMVVVRLVVTADGMFEEVSRRFQCFCDGVPCCKAFSRGFSCSHYAGFLYFKIDPVHLTFEVENTYTHISVKCFTAPAGLPTIEVSFYSPAGVLFLDYERSGLATEDDWDRLLAGTPPCECFCRDHSHCK